MAHSDFLFSNRTFKLFHAQYDAIQHLNGQWHTPTSQYSILTYSFFKTEYHTSRLPNIQNNTFRLLKTQYTTWYIWTFPTQYDSLRCLKIQNDTFQLLNKTYSDFTIHSLLTSSISTSTLTCSFHNKQLLISITY